LLSSLHLLDGLSDLPFLIRFGVITSLPAEGDSASISGMRKFAMCAFAATGDFVKSGCSEIVDKLSDLSWHFYHFNIARTLLDAERQRSPAAGSGSDVGADAVGSQVQRFVRLVTPFHSLLTVRTYDLATPYLF
jgi:hypothetical protein